MWRSLFVVLALCLPLTAHAQVSEAPDCASVSECIAVVREFQIEPPPGPNAYRSSGLNPNPIRRAIERLVGFGDAGAEAVVPLLEDSNYNVQNRAGFALTYFPSIPARHLPALILAHRAGVPWLHGPIAKTGTDEALDFLWADFLSDPNQGSNSQAFFALPRFGDRLFPYVEAELARCRTTANVELCYGVVQLLQPFEPFPAFALPLLEAIATSSEASQDVRDGAVGQLVQQRHPYGLTVLIDRLEARASTLAIEPGTVGQGDGWGSDLDAVILIEDIANYGPTAVQAGPLIEPFVQRRDMPDARTAAALALGQIGYREGIETLLAQSADFADDWFLAYTAAESLGRLRAEQARGALEALAASHWYQPVRNNAARALNFLDGGAFERPNVAGDGGEPPDESEFPITGSDFRYAGDEMSTPGGCTLGEERAYGQFSVGNLRWPRRGQDGETDVELEPRAPTPAQAREFYTAYPSFRERGALMFVVEMGESIIAGVNAGEWGGGVYDIDRRGRSRLIIPENALAAFKSGDTLFVVTGLSHLFVSRGDLWVIERDGGRRPVVQRRIRLPLEPSSYEIAFRETLIIGGQRGAVAIRGDGILIDPREIESCREDEAETR